MTSTCPTAARVASRTTSGAVADRFRAWPHSPPINATAAQTIRPISTSMLRPAAIQVERRTCRRPGTSVAT
jgi:hypothetical protein